jgi:hypothetical protein
MSSLTSRAVLANFRPCSADARCTSVSVAARISSLSASMRRARSRRGCQGVVTAVEIDPALASQARANLAGWPQVDVVAGDGQVVEQGEFDAVIVFAGSTTHHRNGSIAWPRAAGS